ncbi:conserved hypothetical protein [Verticillium alfalfae VaMs.102]|uniref:Uncharacterized protein n=1 Tax=Verticillium alfalfae (strain VaMs.102 / ATCC MYA-4576 / FGSC 10136) TaxID=526221 RepID=C9SKW4_VERA1|nr:conserved hypothetical protein [Verticillium alfalfae VaMs.102]EEY19332.1 conserved hypothetical protein [Verticillium alfalfae VaMs.102]
MPPNVQCLQRLSSFSSSISYKEAKKRQRADPYRWQQSQQRKAANIKRQQEIKAARDATWGDPVHGIPTPFVESFDSAGQAEKSTPPKDEDGNYISEPYALPTSRHIQNHLVTRDEIETAIGHAYTLSKPMRSEIRDLVDPATEQEAERQHELSHKRAVEAMSRITSMNNSNSKMRRHVNIRRRQRLLRYMEKKERGSERWTNLLATLGLSPATWKEQISLNDAGLLRVINLRCLLAP